MNKIVQKNNTYIQNCQIRFKSLSYKTIYRCHYENSFGAKTDKLWQLLNSNCTKILLICTILAYIYVKGKNN